VAGQKNKGVTNETLLTCQILPHHQLVTWHIPHVIEAFMMCGFATPPKKVTWQNWQITRKGDVSKI
jgi:hypothetical protein